MATFSYGQTTAEDDLIEEVEYHADRVLATGQTIGLNYEAIYGNLIKAMRHVLNTAPRFAVDKAAADGSGQSANNVNEYTEVVLPDDFSRFMDLRLADWKREVFELTDPRSSQVRLQYNVKTQADLQNPVIAKVPDPGGTSGEALWAWPQDSTPTIDRFTYVAETAPESIPQILKEATILKATSYTLAAGKEEGWQIMDNAYQQIITQIEAGQQPMVQQAIQKAREIEDS